MTLFFVSSFGEVLLDVVEKIREFVPVVIGVTLAIVVTLLILRLVADLLKLNPFGRIYQSVHKPTNGVIDQMRSSRFYHPLKRSLGFDPAILMVLVALAILWYVVSGVINNLLFVIQGFGSSLISFSNGNFFRGASYLIGSLLLAALFFLMALMTIVFVNWIFGLLRSAAYWAMERLAPLLRIFEFGGAFAGWSFLILWIALSFATAAVIMVFFTSFA